MVERTCAGPALPADALAFLARDWPQPDAQGGTYLPPLTTIRLVGTLTALIDYIEDDHAQCHAPAPAPAAASDP